MRGDMAGIGKNVEGGVKVLCSGDTLECMKVILVRILSNGQRLCLNWPSIAARCGFQCWDCVTFI